MKSDSNFGFKQKQISWRRWSYTRILYKIKFCNQIVPYLAESYDNIYFSENLAHSMKKGIITLIYKNKGNVSELKNWRPISLLNLDYKILTKLLANRLKCITDEI